MLFSPAPPEETSGRPVLNSAASAGYLGSKAIFEVFT